MTRKLCLMILFAGVLGFQQARSQSEPILPTGSGNTKQLIVALPSKGPDGFEKSELNLNSDPYSPASVGIDYNNAGMSINVTITDYKGFMESIGDTYKAQSSNEKNVTVKGKYPGKETLTKMGDFCGGADKIFLVKTGTL